MSSALYNTHFPRSIGLIGTGVMGAPIAGHLLAAGYPVRVFNRTPAKADALIRMGAVPVADPGELAESCDLVFTVLGYPTDVRSIYLDSAIGLIARAAPGSVLVDMTTSEPRLARHLAGEGAKRDVAVLDAPLTGGEGGARAGTLSVMVGGDAAAFERIVPVLRTFSSKQVRHGEAGTGQCAKLTNQIALAGTLMSLCEAWQFAEKAGLDPERLIESIGEGAASSWQMKHLLPEIIRGNDAPGFYAKHFLKDLEIAFEAAEDLYLQLPALELARRLFRKLIDIGHGEKGTQGLIHWYREKNG